MVKLGPSSKNSTVLIDQSLGASHKNIEGQNSVWEDLPSNMLFTES